MPTHIIYGRNIHGKCYSCEFKNFTKKNVRFSFKYTPEII